MSENKPKKKRLSGAAKRKAKKMKLALVETPPEAPLVEEVVVEEPKAPKTDGRPRKSLTNERIEIIAGSMIHGFGKKQITTEELAAFVERVRDTIEWVDEHLPRMISMGVMGAVGKAVLWYGKEKMEPFCRALKSGHFQGQFDPAHILYLYLMGRVRYNPKEAYRKTVTAIRYYMTGRQLVRYRDGEPEKANIVPAETDLFEWDRLFTTMIMRHTNNSKTQFRSVFGDTPSAEEIRIAEEVEEALQELKQ